ncbi:MAG TPA: NAD-dependent epimerase/dehydratase family protein [Candidatus Marinimicrobia bacterium]|nr:NAD-dependent epimerase/dehydratase family protein [Candidatus Neomarinimicrobiota bacterium]
MKKNKHKNILLTGGTGQLGLAIINSGLFPLILAPSRQTLDITKPETIEKYFNEHEIGAVVNCVALARIAECEASPMKAIECNIIGTSALVMAVMNKERTTNTTIRFIHISTDGVYPGVRGNYNERDVTIPYNTYGWTKLGSECVVNLLSDFCVVRTSFFDSKNIRFDSSATDIFSSKVPINYLTKAIALLLESDFVGTVNIGSEKKSDYDRFKEFKSSLKPCMSKDILKDLHFKIASDSSLDSSLWKKIEQNEE